MGSNKLIELLEQPKNFDSHQNCSIGYNFTPMSNGVLFYDANDFSLFKIAHDKLKFILSMFIADKDWVFF